MKFRIHGDCPNGGTDSIDIEADSIEEIRNKAQVETDKREWTNLWSEELD